MSITTETAEDRAEAAREQAQETIAQLAEHTDSGAFLSEARTWASRNLQRTQSVTKDVSRQAVALVRENPIKTAAIGAGLAAAGVAVGFFAIRGRH